MTIECKDGVIPDPTLRAWSAWPLSTSVHLPMAAVRACFEGTMLDRAVAVARLTSAQRVRLFPEKRARHGRNLARVGRRLTSPMVRSELRHAPCGALFAAAMQSDEQTQIRAAMRWMLHLPRMRSTNTASSNA